MKFIVMSSSLKKLLTNRYISSALIVALWLLGMISASLPIVLSAGIIAMAWPKVCLFWHKAYRAKRQARSEANIKMVHAH